MARVLGLLMSGRRRGFTASLLEAASRGAEQVDGVQVEFIHVNRLDVSPCRSCFSCIRSETHDCAQKDAMGAAGELMAQIKAAHGWIIADPVHMWGPTATCHLFIERCYPFLWSGELSGMPFMSMSCASNQGMQRLANQFICKWGFAFGLRYVGGLPVHTTHMAKALQEAEELGTALGRAAVVDAAERVPVTDTQRFVDYLDKPWSALQPYLDNLTDGSMQYEGSLIEAGLTTFKRAAAVELLEQAREPFVEALRLYAAGQQEQACDLLVRASALWTHATWKEFLEEEVIGSTVPEAYRPLEDGREA
jgi:multimeric flavodoxin WrbA